MPGLKSDIGPSRCPAEALLLLRCIGRVPPMAISRRSTRLRVSDSARNSRSGMSAARALSRAPGAAHGVTDTFGRRTFRKRYYPWGFCLSYDITRIEDWFLCRIDRRRDALRLAASGIGHRRQRAWGNRARRALPQLR